MHRGEVSRPGDFADKWAYDKVVTLKKKGKSLCTHARFRTFAKWCVDTFNTDPNATPLHILDIAGGGGKLSAELVKLRQTCTIVDPRTAVVDSIPRITDLFSTTAHATEIQRSDLLLGLHCDGAVNEIVNAACT